MRGISAYLFTSVILLCITFSCKRDLVIPEQELVDIYAEMYMVDQWYSREGRGRNGTDSLLVYGGILDKHGYTVEEFRHSLKRCLDDPERFTAIIKQVQNNYNLHLEALIAEDERMIVRDSLAAEKRKYLRTIKTPPLYKDLLAGYFPNDTVCAGPDSLGFTIAIPQMDTVYDGPAVIVRHIASDSTDVADSTVVGN